MAGASLSASLLVDSLTVAGVDGGDNTLNADVSRNFASPRSTVSFTLTLVLYIVTDEDATEDEDTNEQKGSNSGKDYGKAELLEHLFLSLFGGFSLLAIVYNHILESVK